MNFDTSANYDVVVLGAGPAGLATARALTMNTHLSVLVVDAGDLNHERVGESVPSGILVPLEQLGLDKVFRTAGHQCYSDHASIWGQPVVEYNNTNYSTMHSGWRLNRPLFDAMLVDAVMASGATIAWRTRFLDVCKPSAQISGYNLKLIGEHKTAYWVSAKWVVDATGAKARFANEIGVGREVDDQLFALARFYSVQSGELTQQTLLESCEHGWWYAAVLPDQRVMAMLVTELDHIRRVRCEKHWLMQLEDTKLIGPYLAQLTLSDNHLQTVPIYSSILDTVQGEDWIAVGDAASSFDPIAAQGLYKAMINGVMAGRLISYQLAGAQEIGALLGESYEQEVIAGYQDYYQSRHELYQLEQRWSDMTFWQHRHTNQDKRIARKS